MKVKYLLTLQSAIFFNVLEFASNHMVLQFVSFQSRQFSIFIFSLNSIQLLWKFEAVSPSYFRVVNIVMREKID